MQSYLTPEEAAAVLKVQPADVLDLINERKLAAIRIGDAIRIPEAELLRLQTTSPAVPPTEPATPSAKAEADGPLPDGSRWCLTRQGARFRVSGSVAAGAEIWPGKMRYPIKFPKPFMDALLAHFRGGEVAVGGKFDDPGRGSLGEFIQSNLKIKMNPAVYVAALLIDEGYAESARRGYIRLTPRAAK
jgi:excisionase family DNA binding protein